jgi:hypothetical protein
MFKDFLALSVVDLTISTTFSDRNLNFSSNFATRNSAVGIKCNLFCIGTDIF